MSKSVSEPQQQDSKHNKSRGLCPRERLRSSSEEQRECKPLFKQEYRTEQASKGLFPLASSLHACVASGNFHGLSPEQGVTATPSLANKALGQGACRGNAERGFAWPATKRQVSECWWMGRSGGVTQLFHTWKKENSGCDPPQPCSALSSHQLFPPQEQLKAEISFSQRQLLPVHPESSHCQPQALPLPSSSVLLHQPVGDVPARSLARPDYLHYLEQQQKGLMRERSCWGFLCRAPCPTQVHSPPVSTELPPLHPAPHS